MIIHGDKLIDKIHSREIEDSFDLAWEESIPNFLKYSILLVIFMTG